MEIAYTLLKRKRKITATAVTIEVISDFCLSVNEKADYKN